MQEKMQIISPIKQRILHFIDFLGISKRKFYEETGISRGTIESKTGITEEIMAKFIATYDDVNIDWLITGEGDMIKSNETNSTTTNKTETEMDCESLRKDIERYQQDIERYRQEIDYLNNELQVLRHKGEPERKRRSA